MEKRHKCLEEHRFFVTSPWRHAIVFNGTTLRSSLVFLSNIDMAFFAQLKDKDFNKEFFHFKIP
jgi:hypothetical protein